MNVYLFTQLTTVHKNMKTRTKTSHDVTKHTYSGICRQGGGRVAMQPQNFGRLLDWPSVFICLNADIKTNNLRLLENVKVKYL